MTLFPALCSRSSRGSTVASCGALSLHPLSHVSAYRRRIRKSGAGPGTSGSVRAAAIRGEQPCRLFACFKGEWGMRLRMGRGAGRPLSTAVGRPKEMRLRVRGRLTGVAEVGRLGFRRNTDGTTARAVRSVFECIWPLTYQ